MSKVCFNSGCFVVGGWYWRFFPRRTGAFVVGSTVHFRESVGARANLGRPLATLVAHEWCHVGQWQEYGWTFLPRYVWQIARGVVGSLLDASKGSGWLRPFEVLNQMAKLPSHIRSAYRKCDIEVEADEYAAEHWVYWMDKLKELP